jgi:tetratricopeptide (TPR) repeat protein
LSNDISAQTIQQNSGRHELSGFSKSSKRRYLASRTIPAFLLLAVLFARNLQLPAVSAQGTQAGNYTGISVQASPQIFAVMCALDAAGFDANQNLLGDQSPARAALRKDLTALHGPAAESLRQFYRDHALGDPAETLSRYITFAVVAGPPPEFALSDNRDLLPPDVLSIDGFQAVLADFYREAHLDQRWAQVQPGYQTEIAPYNAEVARIATLVNAYLREVIRPSSGRSFTVEVEPAVGGQTNFRNFGDAYSIVVGRFSDDSAGVIRHAYLHFMIDPFVLRNRALLDKHRAALDIAAHDPLIPEEYQDDIVGLMDESVIKAVEIRLDHHSGSALDRALQDADASGYVLVRPLVASLAKFEKAEPAMSYYFGDIVTDLDNIDQVQLKKVVAQATPGELRPVKESHGDSVSDSERWLADGESQIAQKNGEAAAASFEHVLAKSPENPRALYGLAIAYVLTGRAEDARDLFEKIIALASSKADAVAPATLAWSHVYLGRMHDLASERDLAVSEYSAALAVKDAPEATRTAAHEGLTNPYAPPGREQQGSQQ